MAKPSVICTFVFVDIYNITLCFSSKNILLTACDCYEKLSILLMLDYSTKVNY